MHTKESLGQFANWLEENLEIDDEEKKRIATGVSSGLSKNGIDYSNLSIGSLVGLFRMKIRLVKFCGLGICKKEYEKDLFAGLEKWRNKYETALKRAKKDSQEEGDKERVSGWW